jgi:hypothetical protein
MRHSAICCAVLSSVLGCGNPASVALPEPPAGQGFQLKVSEFAVNPGEEVQNCYFFEVPGPKDADVWVNRYQLSQTDGSHHMNIFRIATIKNLIGAPGESVLNGECFKSPNWSDWPLVVNTQQDGNTDWKLPDGVGAKFKGGELLMLQTHYVNATTQKTPGKATVYANFWTLPTAPANELGTMFATNQNIQICPGDTDRFFTKTCRFPSAGINIVAANGHFHSRGKKFEMFTADATGNLTSTTPFYTSTSWDDPPMMRANANQSLATLEAGTGVQWKCTFDFPQGGCGDGKDPVSMEPNCCYTFGPTVEKSEHCNAFVYYWPKTQDVNCF